MDAPALQDDLPEMPYHPPYDFKFPKSFIGDYLRSFQPNWCSKWKWLHYAVSENVAYCHLCSVALKSGLLKLNDETHSVFIVKGFSNWKYGPERFRSHELSGVHQFADEAKEESFKKVFGYIPIKEGKNDLVHANKIDKLDNIEQMETNASKKELLGSKEILVPQNDKAGSHFSLNEVPEKPYQPVKTSKHIDSSKQKYMREFPLTWFKRWKWLHYDKETDALYCHWCLVAIKSGIITLSRLSILTYFGLNNWKNPIAYFKFHEKIEFHSRAAELNQECLQKVFGTSSGNKEIKISLNLEYSSAEEYEDEVNKFRGNEAFNDIPEHPFQPQHYKFPYREFSSPKCRRYFQIDWFKRWNWLHYDTKHDVAFCHWCAIANKSGIMVPSRPTALTTEGFCAWKIAVKVFGDHEKTKFHKKVVLVKEKCISKVFHKKASTSNEVMKTDDANVRSNEVEKEPGPLSPKIMESYEINVLVVGDSGCGKRTFINLIHPTNIDEFQVQFSIGSISGMETDDEQRVSCYSSRINLVLMMFSLDHPNSSLNIVDKWFPEVRHYFPGVPVILVCNKADLSMDNSSLNDDSFKSSEESSWTNVVFNLGESIGAFKTLICSTFSCIGIFDIYKAAFQAFWFNFQK